MARMHQWITEFGNSGSQAELVKEPIEKNIAFPRVVLNFLPNPFYAIDASDYTIKAANSASQFAKLSEDSTCYALTHNTDRPCNSTTHPCPVERIRETRQPVVVEHLHYDKDGNPMNVVP